jgi:ketosteroid isomerase-like protein
LSAVSETNSFDLLLVVLRFNEMINQRDLEGLAELMADDYTFISNSGEVTKGKDVNKQGWKEFFEEYPDYKNIFTTTTVQNNIVVMVGYSACSCKRLDGPNTWTAKIRNGRISEWRVIWLDQR